MQFLRPALDGIHRAGYNGTNTNAPPDVRPFAARLPALPAKSGLEGRFTMKIRFSADSTCDMSPDFIARHQVRVIPLGVELDGTFYKDGVDITPDEIIARVNQGAPLPKTSAINVDEYRQAFAEMLEDADAVLHFNISAEFSSCWQNACLAAEGLPVYCIDSRSLSSGIAMLLAEGADRAAAGEPAEEIARELTNLTDKLDVSFIVDRLDYLYKGGRCSMVAMLGANVLHLRPCIEVVDGKMVVGKKYRGTYERCLRQYLADRLKDRESLSLRRAFITHTGLAPVALETIHKIVSDTLDIEEIYEVRAGSTITSHCGENTFGLILMRK